MSTEIKKKENYLPVIENLIEKLMDKTDSTESLNKALDLMVEYEKIKAFNYIGCKLNGIEKELSEFRF